MKNFLLTSLGIVLLAGTGCDKTEVTPKNEVSKDASTSVNNGLTKDPDTGMSLAEFIASCESDYEVEFFNNTPLTDNTAMWQSHTVSGGKIKFKWHGTKPGGHGCETPLGICLIIGVSDPTYPDLMTIPVGIDGDKLSLHFIAGVNDNFGLTTDGYMPILFNVDLPDEMINELGTGYTKVKCGIYKASVDADGQYMGVVLDLI